MGRNRQKLKSEKQFPLEVHCPERVGSQAEVGQDGFGECSKITRKHSSNVGSSLPLLWGTW